MSDDARPLLDALRHDFLGRQRVLVHRQQSRRHDGKRIYRVLVETERAGNWVSEEVSTEEEQMKLFVQIQADLIAAGGTINTGGGQA